MGLEEGLDVEGWWFRSRVNAARFRLWHRAERIIARDGPASETAHEREGDVGYVTFPYGYTLDADGDGINLYYGAADTSVALAKGSVTQILGWLDRHDAVYPRAE